MSSEKDLVSQKYKRVSRVREVIHRVLQNKGAVVGLIIILIVCTIALTVDLWMDYDTQVIAINSKARFISPCREHPFGTDRYGRDIFCRVLYGTKYSLSIGFVSVLIALFIGAVFGSLAGYFGGAVDNIIMRIVDVFAAIPGILMGIVIVAALGASTGTLMLAVGISSAPSFVRVTRAAVMTTRNSEYVQAAKSIGLVDLKIIFTHVLPNCISPIIVQATLKIANAIVSAAGLSFLGMGIPVPAPEWGSMLADGRNYIRQYSYMCLWPGVAIMVVVLAFNLLGDGLRDAMDPKLRK